MHFEIEPTSHGLLRCLQVLAEEAGCLRLPGTFAALHQAIEACRAEIAKAGASPFPADAVLRH